MPTPDQIRQYIATGLECQHVAVTGDGTHFEALVVSAAFEGKRTLERQRMVYAALGDRMREEIHALSMQTRTPAEYGS
jgi:acid stress-induced BolA-like protein IbaG/YrbA